ncbi:MAG: indole-3-glycerol-phosphate synthase TrpC, partial [Bacteroidota bacterium]
NEAELEIALALGAALIGVNNRDLRTFQVDPGVALRLLPLIPPDVTAVAESGIAGPAEASLFCRAGARALLVGEALVRSGDPAAAVQALREAV